MKRLERAMLYSMAGIVLAMLGLAATPYVVDTINLETRGVRVVPCMDDEDGTCSPTTATNPLPVGGSLTVSGTVTADQGADAGMAGGWPMYITDTTDFVDVTAANALKVDGSATSQPVEATDLDIRDLTYLSDSVTTHAAALNNYATQDAAGATCIPLCSIPAGRNTFPVVLGLTGKDIVMCSSERAIVHILSAGDQGWQFMPGECLSIDDLAVAQLFVDTATIGKATSFRVLASSP